MTQIRILDHLVANQIAAGEVVERPASIVKELIENAVDAHATQIELFIEEGGLELIRVKDNGQGIASDDCERAFLRHATSKIQSGNDLFHIRTLGFRGEALPSIAAVAKVECVTAADSTGLGRRIKIEGGMLISNEDAAAMQGTDIVVREMFYNTPARLKYMKTVQTELTHITDYVYRMAMAHPQIAFTCKHNGHTLLQTLGTNDLLQVIAAVYGVATAKKMLQLQAESLDYLVIGYVSLPELTRANRNGVSLFINGRAIRNFAINQAILRAYHTLLPINRFPLAAIHIEMDPSLLDVNVHPSKMEVRFSKEAELIEVIENGIRQLLHKQTLIPEARKQEKPAAIQEQMPLYRPTDASSTVNVPRTPAPPRDKQRTTNEEASRLQNVGRDEWQVNDKSRSEASAAKQKDAISDWSASSMAQPAANRIRNNASLSLEQLAQVSQSTDEQSTGSRPARPVFPSLQPIGQLHGTYIIAQNEEGMYLIDQHAAHERMNYEYYYKRFGQPTDASQTLLVPITLDFTAAEASILQERLPLLEQAGVYMEPFGGHSFIVRAYPHWLPQGEEQSIMEEMIDWVLQEKKAVDIAKLREAASTMCSCKASIKANQRLSVEEIGSLLDQLGQCDQPFTCPHGRPIVIHFTTYELEKMFKRVM